MDIPSTMHAIVLHEYGGPENLVWDCVPIPETREKHVLVRVEASGVNFIDTYIRQGFPPYNKSPLPDVMGREASGTIVRVGENGSGAFQVGDRVAFAPIPGSYAEYVNVPEDKLARIPDGVSFVDAAAVMLQGLTAHYLAFSTYSIQPDQWVLVHAASGGVGRLLVQIAKRIGARVVGTVSTQEKMQEASDVGCDYVINYTQENFVDAFLAYTGGAKAHVVYDAVGKDTFLRSISCVRPRGMIVLYGQSSGAVEPIDPQILSQQGSISLSRPSLIHYISSPDELNWRASDLFEWIRDGSLVLKVCETVPMSEASRAHDMLEKRLVIGKLILIPPSAST